MTHALFLQDSGINESLALTEASALLKAAGHRTHLLLGDEERDLRRAIRRYDPDLALIPCPVAGHRRALDDAALLKEVAPRCVTLLAGTYATFNPDLARLPQVDAVCLGEAEGALLELADRLEAGRPWQDVANLCVEEDEGLRSNPLRPLTDLDSLPPPDRALYFRYPFVAALPWKKFSTGRGCLHSCGFCWNVSLREMYDAGGEFVRRKSPARAVAEIAEVAAAHPLRRVHFSDDLFTVHPAWLEEFAGLYRERVGVPFTCNSSVPLVTERTLAALADAGCCGVAIGIETGNEALRGSILGKTVTNEQIRRAARLIKGRGLELVTYNMVGSPGETIEDVRSTIALNREIGVDRVRVNLAIPLPHTRFEETAFSLGFLDERSAADRIEGLTDADLAGSTADRTALVNLYLLFRLAVHVPASDRLVRRLVHAGDLRALHVFRLWGIYEEKQITGLRWLEGLRYFRHVGDPRKRTANYVTLP